MKKRSSGEIKEGQVLRVEYGGKLIIPVFGEEFSQGHKQTRLKQLYKETEGKVSEFSLTPQDEYQAQKGWPEEPFLNVMPRGEYTVRKDNWLGFIQPPEYHDEDSEELLKDSELDNVKRDRRKYTLKLISLGKKMPLIVKGKVIKEKDSAGQTEYSMLLFASRKDIDLKLEEAKSLQPKWQAKRDKKATNKRILIIGLIIILAIVGIIFWQFALGLLVLGAILAISGSKK